jgi:hypothetical protein
MPVIVNPDDILPVRRMPKLVITNDKAVVLRQSKKLCLSQTP